MTPSQAAIVANVRPRTIRANIREGRLPAAKKANGRLDITAQDLKAWMQKREQPRSLTEEHKAKIGAGLQRAAESGTRVGRPVSSSHPRAGYHRKYWQKRKRR